MQKYGDQTLKNKEIQNYLPSRMIILLDLGYSLELHHKLGLRHDAKRLSTYEHVQLVADPVDNGLKHDICQRFISVLVK